MLEELQERVRQLEEENQELRERVAFAESIPNCLGGLDKGDSIYAKYYQDGLVGEFAYVNQRKASNSGVTVEDMIGESDFNFMTKEQARKSRVADLEVVNTGVPVIDRVEKITRANGSEVYVSVSKYPWIINDEMVGIVGMSRDVTKRKEVEQLMLYGVLAKIHDFKGISVSIEAFTNILSEGDPDKSRKYFDRVSKLAKNLASKCDQTYARIISMLGGITPRKRLCDLRLDAINPVLTILADKIEDKGVTIDDSLGLIPTETIMINADPDLLREVCLVCLDNAVKYCQSTISFGYELHENFLQFNFCDDGTPIAVEDQPYLFTKYKGNMKRHKHSGSGWGLYLVHKIVQAHGGTVRYETTANGLKNFVVTLPR